ncbi:unnamed protein product [Pleuronectes platessa]|uniref:Uncharacterized protein n=1 Tax=Pleuronectes platessa TaxID=8262 RepID=A0A9N7U0A9_PLEPL|nr:unnamed protein product [Pleuronectes platessa]
MTSRRKGGSRLLLRSRGGLLLSRCPRLFGAEPLQQQLRGGAHTNFTAGPLYRCSWTTVPLICSAVVRVPLGCCCDSVFRDVVTEESEEEEEEEEEELCPQLQCEGHTLQSEPSV